MTNRFIVTKEHRRFIEFADSVRHGNTIGICYGAAGIGKTVSARRYAGGDKALRFVDAWDQRPSDDLATCARIARHRTVFYTPTVMSSPKALRDDLDEAFIRTSFCIEDHLAALGRPVHNRDYPVVELIIVDESERLSATALELLRDRYDRTEISLILIGMPGFEKQFSRYPQFYSRVGFAHQYRPLGHDELLFVLERHWRRLGKTLDVDDFTDAQAIAAIARVTRGNFRLLERLFPQIERVLKINELDTITNDVVEAAASTLVIGIT